MLRQLVGATRGIGGEGMLEDVLPNPLSNVDELTSLCEPIREEGFKKKMVNHEIPSNIHSHTKFLFAKLLVNLSL